MFIRLNESAFVQAFDEMNRGDNYTVAARRALFAHFEEIGLIGDQLELDVIAICCEFSEYETAVCAADDLGIEFDREEEDGDGDEHDEENEANALAAIQYDRSVIEIDGGGLLIGD